MKYLDPHKHRIIEFLEKKYKNVLKQDESFSFEERHDGGSIYITVTLKNKDDSFNYPVEGMVTPSEADLKGEECAQGLLDLIGSYFDEYFREDRDLLLPIDWKEYAQDGCTFYLRGQVRNLKAEKMADDLLREGKPRGSGSKK